MATNKIGSYTIDEIVETIVEITAEYKANPPTKETVELLFNVLGKCIVSWLCEKN
jgi:hypothetical protein